MSRKSIPPKDLAAESAAITQFLFDVAEPKEGTKLPLQVVFQRYHLWRSKNRLTPTRLSIDGFGRLFPHVYPRKSAYWAPAAHSLKCIFGLSIKS